MSMKEALLKFYEGGKVPMGGPFPRKCPGIRQRRCGAFLRVDWAVDRRSVIFSCHYGHSAELETDYQPVYRVAENESIPTARGCPADPPERPEPGARNSF